MLLLLLPQRPQRPAQPKATTSQQRKIIKDHKFIRIIPDLTFDGCYDLHAVTLSDGIKYIGRILKTIDCTSSRMSRDPVRENTDGGGSYSNGDDTDDYFDRSGSNTIRLPKQSMQHIALDAFDTETMDIAIDWQQKLRHLSVIVLFAFTRCSNNFSRVEENKLCGMVRTIDSTSSTMTGDDDGTERQKKQEQNRINPEN